MGSTRRATTAWAAVVAALLLLPGCATAPAPPPDAPLARTLAGQVGAEGATVHLEALQTIADDNGGDRASGGPGYERSVDYVAGALRDAGFEVTTPAYEVAPGQVLRNVVAQTRTGDPAAVVMAGAHLDSVSDGPGLNDDGSGVAALLEIAEELGPDPDVRHAVRFGFWGSEEDELQGSTGYVRSLSAPEQASIALYLNLDMLASPNGGYFVQGGEGMRRSSSGPSGSETVARVLTEELARTGVTAETIPFTGDDESAFVEADIPVGGAVTGDDETKTAEQARAWGGEPGAVYDRCYHESCDRLGNVDETSLDRYTRAVAGTLARFATAPDRPLP
ncbi:aminopeptidase S [Pseudonocardia sediminis]|uniref:Aminopeptidase S n=1 Tax=Pseudonocardia sediminis TaxID=1397368 RepID=A0A4Q7V090_PSEST|nr:M28 family peptidase [Pseudonocardia sediminis]RZT85983.1 aminopeptidase S [Pseudonocardia sediminis]